MMADDGRLERLRDWLTGEGHRVRFLETLFGELCNRLVGEGMPVERATLHARILHPMFMAARLLWKTGDEEAEVVRSGYGIAADPMFLRSPVYALFHGAEGIRQRLDVPGVEDAFPVYDELRAEGYTDYVGMPLVFTTGQRLATSWSTRRPGGFTTAELVVLERLCPLLAMAAEIRVNRRLARTLAATYLGARTGGRVLEGRIRRGDVERLQAAIWFLDMRGFTTLADRMDQDRLIERLNRFFEAFGEPVFAHGGEILKFMGDAMLAVFPDPAEGERCPPLQAAFAGLANLRTLNAELCALGEPPIDCGLALHWGEVSYGNIGTPERLDFTVIGPAVNEAARLQEVARTLREPIILSAAFAARTRHPTRSLGAHRVRGVEAPLAVFAPAEPKPVA